MTCPLKKLELARLHTPLQALKRDSVEYGGGVWIKRDDLTGIGLSGNKVRKLEYLGAAALRDNASVLITCGGAQSNHARATALCAARLGMRSHLILRGTPSQSRQGNLLLSRLVGARITWVSPEEYKNREDIFRRLEEDYRSNGEIPYSIPEGGSNGLGVYGYLACYQELLTQCEESGIEPEFIYVAIGSGGTFAGLQAGWELAGRSGPRPVGIPVCDNAKFFRGRVQDILRHFRELEGREDEFPNEFAMEDGFVGDGYALSRPHELEMIAQIARAEALFLDPVYTVKAFLGMLAHRKQAQRSLRPAIFLHTGGVFGLYGLKDGLQLDEGGP